VNYNQSRITVFAASHSEQLLHYSLRTLTELYIQGAAKK